MRTARAKQMQMMTVNTIKTAKVYLKENFFLCDVSLSFLKINLTNWIFFNYDKMYVPGACTEKYADLLF